MAHAAEMHVDVRTKKAVVKADLTLDEAQAFLLELPTTVGYAVVLPSGGLLGAGTQFTMWRRSVQAAQARFRS